LQIASAVARLVPGPGFIVPLLTKAMRPLLEAVTVAFCAPSKQ
jgi:hypothetical protein